MNPSIQTEAEKLLHYIEAQTRYIMNQMTQVIEIILNGKPSEKGYEALSKEKPLRPSDLERFANHWQAIVPNEPVFKATLAHLIGTHHALIKSEMPRLWRILGLEDPLVQTAHQELYQQSLEEMLAVTGQVGRQYSPLSIKLQALHLEMLQDALERVYLPSGEVLFHEGDAGDSMYVVASGRLKVVVGHGRHERAVAELGRYEMIGEMALVTDSPRTATLIAIRDTELWRISRSMFQEIAMQHPQTMFQVMQMISKRLELLLKGQEKRYSEAVHTIAIVPAGSHANTHAFTLDLAQTLALYGSVLYLNSSRINQLFEAGAATIPHKSLEEARLVGWLNEQETLHQFVIYEADETLTEWTKRCLRQADRVLLVGEPGGNSTLNAIEEALFNSSEFNASLRKELVLLHKNMDQPPRHTAQWLAKRTLTNHYHIAATHPEHLQRLIRFLLGRPVILVLSGGSVRAFAHIGVLKALEEAGIPIDAVCGTSAGAIVGVNIAAGLNADQITNRTVPVFKKARQLMDFTPPFTSWLGGRGLNNLLNQWFGEMQIEDLWLKFMCTSADLTNSHVFRHDHGSIRRAIRASSAIPGFLPPIMEQGHVLVDGGLINNMPVSEMLNVVGNGVIILCNVIPENYPDDSRFNFGDYLSWGDILSSRFNPFRRKVIAPGMIELIRRSSECNARTLQLQEISKANLYIPAIMSNIAFSDVSQIDNLVTLGYTAAQAQLEKWNEIPYFSQ